MRRLHRRGIFRWARAWLWMVLFLAVLGDFIANELPLFCRYHGKIHFPVIEQILSNAGIYQPFFNATTDWSAPGITAKIYPPIPYSAHTIDIHNANFRSPFDRQEVPSVHFRHWLGTDKTGRDVLAGLIAGARVSAWVSIAGMSLALLFGLLVGGTAGYFGDRDYKTSRPGLVAGLLGISAAAWSAYAASYYVAPDRSSIAQFTLPIVLPVVILIATYYVIQSLRRYPKVSVPLDAWSLRIIEIFTTVPALLWVLVLSAILPPSVHSVALIIGLASGPGIARYLRSEMIKIRQREYIRVAKMENIPDRIIFLRYALPMAAGPAMIVTMTGLGRAVLTEATLSFLGLGLPPDTVTWGKMLTAARLDTHAWWLALFPGAAIFLTIFSANYIGGLLLDAIRAR